MSKTILVVTNTALTGAVLVQMIAHQTPHLMLLVTTSAEALELTQDIKPDLFLFETLLSPMPAMELYQCLHERKVLYDVPVLLLRMLGDLQEQQPDVETSTQMYSGNLFPFPNFLLLLTKILDTVIVR